MTPEDDRVELYFGNLFADFCRHVENDGWGDKTFIDFGCGWPGYNLKYRRFFAQGYAVDIQDLESEYADVEKVKFVRSDGHTIPLPDSVSHYVFSHSTLEHVSDIRASLQEIHRVLKTRGIAYLTVSPLYYSPRGGHIGMKNWEHLDPDSKSYIDDRAGTKDAPHNLNRLTISKLLSEVGRLPWNILSFTIRPQFINIPRPNLLPDVSDFDMHVREFRLIIKKQFNLRDGMVVG